MTPAEDERRHRRDLAAIPAGLHLEAIPTSAGPPANPFAGTMLAIAVELLDRWPATLTAGNRHLGALARKAADVRARAAGRPPGLLEAPR